MSDYVTKTNVLSALARFKENTDALYETKADANVMKSEINQHDARLQNLEQKAGDYSIVQYRGTNAVPTGKAKYGLVKSIVGKTRAWNNVFDPSKYASSATVNGITFTNNGDGTVTLSGTASADANFSLGQQFRIINGEPYILGCGIAKSGVYLSNNYTSALKVEGVAYDYKISGYTANAIFYISVDSGTVISTPITAKPMFRNLKLIFPEGVPATVADALAQLPALGQYNAYDAGSLVDTTVTGAKAIGRNLIDWSAITADAFVRSADGVVQSYGSGDVNATDYIPVVGGSSYFFGGFNSPNSGNSGAIYDINKNYIGAIYDYTDLQPITIPANGAYVRLSLWLANFSDAENSAYFTLNSNPHAFTPYQRNTLMLSTPVTFKSAGSVAEVLDVQTGKKTRPIGSEDLGTLEWIWDDDNSGCWSTTSLASTIKKPASNTVIGDMSCALYAIVPNDDTYSHLSVGISVATTGRIRVYDPNLNSSSNLSTLFSGKILNYALATPDTDQQVCDPIIDNTILTEGGGTIDTIQDQSPVIDNCLDVGYLAV